MTTAYVNKASEVRSDLDTFAALPYVEIKGSALRAGMILIDPELHTPIGEVDHKMRSQRGSGAVSFLMFDFDARSWTTESVTANGIVKVMAA